MTDTEKLKWQIHAESSISDLLKWVIIWKLFGGWVGYVCFFLIILNMFTFLKSGLLLLTADKKYFDIPKRK